MATVTYESGSHLKTYLREVSRTQPLTREEEQRLARRMRSGDLAARNHLVSSNLRFAVKIARHYSSASGNSGVSLEDLISAANVGLLEAARRYDGLTGVRFITYAVWWIRQSILKTLNLERRLVRVPGHVSDLLSKVSKVSSSLLQDYERQPEPEEIAEEMQVPLRAVQRALSVTQDVRSLEEEVGDHQDDGGLCLGDVLADARPDAADDAVERGRLEEEIHRLLDALEPREAEVIRRYYGLNGRAEDSLAEIGRQMHLSRERIRQIKIEGLNHLRRQVRPRMGLGEPNA